MLSWQLWLGLLLSSVHLIPTASTAACPGIPAGTAASIPARRAKGPKWAKGCLSAVGCLAARRASPGSQGCCPPAIQPLLLLVCLCVSSLAVGPLAVGFLTVSLLTVGRWQTV